ncbi:MAG: class I SAM-dependent RNA methyltransferase [Bdellovibrionales bacterium]|nr:class I SAM-dependent RNA methyltransferase [Bdellovibrionales bacterium]
MPTLLGCMKQAQFSCEIAPLCSGCPTHHLDFEIQTSLKINQLLSKLEKLGLSLKFKPKIHSIALGGLRDRTDLVIESTDNENHIGLYHINSKNVLDMPDCPQLSPSLRKWFKEFRKDLPPIKRGSVRLRTSPAERFGVWLDFSNKDVKGLLDEQNWLLRLMKKAQVEIGQKRKALYLENGRLSLGKPRHDPWFETYDLSGRSIPLYCSIASFTQPGFRANLRLVNEVVKSVLECGGKRWIELFCGVGNFTIPLAMEKIEMTGFDVDRFALAGAQRSISELKSPIMCDFKYGNANKKLAIPRLDSYDGLLVDPPRSGLKSVLDHIKDHDRKCRPRHLVYVSCHTPSLCSDLAILFDLGYQLVRATGIDQFPMTPHCEWIVSLSQLPT